MAGENSGTRVVKSLCNLCTLCCGLDVTVEDGRITKINGMPEHPYNKICTRAAALIEWVYSPERITDPMKRIGDKWERISWEQALDEIADKLTELREQYGAKTLLTHFGVPHIATQLARAVGRFCSAFGTPNYTSGGSLCFIARPVSYGLTFNHQGLALLPSMKDTRCIVIWGRNPTESHHMLLNAIDARITDGAKLIVIDPRRTELAKKANIHVMIRPGTDCALALGIMNAIISEGLYDKDFVENWTVGFDKLAEHVKEWTPEKVEEVTWVPADTVREIARTYATTKPSTILQGISIDHSTNGGQTIRAIGILVAITGQFDVAGGSTFFPPVVQQRVRLPGRVNIKEAVGKDFPLFTKLTSESQSNPAINVMRTGKPYPIKAVVVQASNPALTWPNSSKVKEAFQSLELFVVIDLFMTETAKLAHYFLPTATFLEGQLLKDQAPLNLPRIIFDQKAIEPIGNSWDEVKIWSELGRRMGYEELFPWRTNQEFCDFLLEGTDFTTGQLSHHPAGLEHGPKGERRYLKAGKFGTPSGKVEIYSETMAQAGVDPLPTFHEPAGSPLSAPEIAKEYPLIAITGPRSRFFTHTQLHNIPMMRNMMPENFIGIHPSTAENLGIADGDMVKVESPRGRIQLRAKVTADIHPSVVSISHAFAEANVNLLSDHEELDPLNGYPGFKQILVKVTKV